MSTTNDPTLLTDGFNILRKGMNSGVAPDFLGREALSLAVNAAFRGGKIHPRPGITRRPLKFDSGETREAFEGGYFQGAHPYVWSQGDAADCAYLVVSISGRIFRIDLTNFDCFDMITPGIGINPPHYRQAWFEQAEMFLIIQDGQSVPFIWDGATLKRSNVIQGQVPVGTIMRYALGRLTVVLPDGRAFVAGNIVGSEEGKGTLQYQFRDSLLWFTENDLLASGGVFAARERVTALHEIQVIDKTVNQDPLFIFSRKGGALANYPKVRELWDTTQSPIVVGGLRSTGPAGHNSILGIHSDIWYRAADATIRSLKMSQRDFQSWGDTPMSKEVSRVLKHDQIDLLKHGSAVYFDNRLIVTCSPRYEPRGVVHYGLISLDFDEPSSLERDGVPAYDGLWTGLRVLQIMTADVRDVERCFALGVDPEGKIGLWELSKADRFDNLTTSRQRIPVTLETPRYIGGGKHRQLKRLVGGEMFPTDIVGDVDFLIEYRADADPVWRTWYGWKECAEQKCLSPCELPNTPQYRGRIPFPSPVNSVRNSQIERPTTDGYSMQARIKMTGSCQIDQFTIDMRPAQEQAMDRCRGDEPCKTLQSCDGPLFDYRID